MRPRDRISLAWGRVHLDGFVALGPPADQQPDRPDWVRVAQALEVLPALSEASGRLSWDQVVIVCEYATADTDAEVTDP